MASASLDSTPNEQGRLVQEQHVHPPIVLDGVMSACDQLVNTVIDAVIRRNDHHVENLIRTLVALRREQFKNPDLACLENLANQISILLENDCGLTEISPRPLDLFNQVLHRPEADTPTMDPDKIGRIERCLGIGIMHRGNRFKNFSAAVARYVPVQPNHGVNTTVSQKGK